MDSVLNNRYRIEKPISAGGFGWVYLAQDTSVHSRRVVVKILQEKLANDAWYLKKFRLETEALAKIDHPGVVKVIDMGFTSANLPFFVMEYIDGVTLSQEIVPGGMDRTRAASIVRQIGRALRAAHDCKVWHRDLKPSNIMLRRLANGEEIVKLIDFGIATVLDAGRDAESKTRPVGSERYMAPEQANGAVSELSDIYSFGVVAYELLTGVRPPAGEDLPNSLPPRAQDLIRQAIAPNPSARPREANEFGDQLACALMEEPSPLQRNDPSTEIGHILFMDLAGLPALPVQQQSKLLDEFQKVVRRTKTFRQAEKGNDLVAMTTADGMALVFFREPGTPARCAIELSKALRRQPRIRVRMGIHSGPISRNRGIPGNLEIVGSGIELAQRVMECAEPGQVFVSRTAADSLAQLQPWAGKLTALGQSTATHGARVDLFRLHTGPAPTIVVRASIPAALHPKGAAVRRGLVAGCGAGAIVMAGLWWNIVHRPSDRDVPAADAPAAVRTQPASPPPPEELEYIPVQPGTFAMGCSASDSECDEDEKPAHPVRIARGFRIGRTEVTVRAYKAFATAANIAMPRTPPFNAGWSGLDQPIVNVDWEGAQAFCASERGRLPTEAEWEYVARAGNPVSRYGELAEIAWFNRNSNLRARPAGRKQPNAAGVQDMLGNVWEWTADWYKDRYDATGEAVNPVGPIAGEYRVIRGGSWSDDARNIRASSRARRHPQFRVSDLGFRCVRDEGTP